MIGYHYTTWTAWHDIQRDGLKLSPLEKRHRKGFWFILEFVGMVASGSTRSFSQTTN
jgi:hypothetical protein